MQACWLSKEFEVRLAARGEEALHLFVFLDGLDNFALVERAGVVLVEDSECLPQAGHLIGSLHAVLKFAGGREHLFARNRRLSFGHLVEKLSHLVLRRILAE